MSETIFSLFHGCVSCCPHPWPNPSFNSFPTPKEWLLNPAQFTQPDTLLMTICLSCQTDKLIGSYLTWIASHICLSLHFSLSHSLSLSLSWWGFHSGIKSAAMLFRMSVACQSPYFLFFIYYFFFVSRFSHLTLFIY